MAHIVLYTGQLVSLPVVILLFNLSSWENNIKFLIFLSLYLDFGKFIFCDTVILNKNILCISICSYLDMCLSIPTAISV